MFKNLRISGAAASATTKTPTKDLVDDDEDPHSPVPCTDTGNAATPHGTLTSSSESSSLTSSMSPPPSFTSSTSLLEDLADALIGAVAVYGMADVRSLLRSSYSATSTNADSSSSPTPALLLHGDPDLLRKAMELPITRSEMMQLLQSNLDTLHENKIPADLYLSLLDSFGGSATTTSAEASTAASPSLSSNYRWLHSIFKNIPVPAALSSSELSPPLLSGGSQGSVGASGRRHHPPSVYVAVFDDENSNKELVYYIAVDEERKLLKVVFRGSVTVGDWVADIDSRMATVPNPLLRREPTDDDSDGTPTLSPTVSIHQGFYTYLLGTTNSKSGTPSSNKYDTIVGHLRRLLVEHPEYKIRVSGHSLGGALSTVFAFVAASDPDLPKPITCVSFASPRVGNLDMARAYQHLEIRGWLRSIRVVNDKDVITHVPDRLAYAVALTNSIYRHVGIELKLYPSGKDGSAGPKHPRIHFPACHPTLAQHLADDASRAAWNWFTRPMNVVTSWRHDYAVNHSCKEYSDRLSGATDFLQAKTLDDLMDEYMAHCHS